MSGTLFSLHGNRVDTYKGNMSVLYSPRGNLPNTSAINYNDFHCAAGHSHEVLLRKTAEQQGIVLEGEMHECKGCPMANGCHKGIKQSTPTRAEKKLGGGCLSGPRMVESLGGEAVHSHSVR